MTEKEYNRIVDLLIKTTQAGNLKWMEDKSRFSTTVNGCGISLYPDYDTLIGNATYSLDFSNPQGMVFNTYSADELSDKSGYDRLDGLYRIIKDSVYQITESERKILYGLEELAVKNNISLKEEA